MKEKISLVRCGNYGAEHVLASVRQSVDLLGGMAAFIGPGERVLIKPNLLKGNPPEDAVTTHPEVVRAVIRLVREAGAEPVVGDSPGIGDLRKVAERTGIMAVLEQEGAALAEFSETAAVAGAGRFQRLEVARTAAEADAIINLPKLKTHGMMTLTGAVKNLFGCVPGKRKVQWHFNTGVDHGSFALLLVDICRALKPRLTIMDAVVGMEGNGPGSGDPRAIGAILAGCDPVAVDAVAGVMVGVEPETLPVIRAALASHAGETRLENIEVIGARLADVIVGDFRLPPRTDATEWQLPEWVRRRLKDALTTRPIIDHVACVRCGVCRTDCPQQVISERHGTLVIDYRRCIRCFCCQEFCPQGAITVGRGWLLRVIKASGPFVRGAEQPGAISRRSHLGR